MCTLRVQKRLMFEAIAMNCIVVPRGRIVVMIPIDVCIEVGPNIAKINFEWFIVRCNHLWMQNFMPIGCIRLFVAETAHRLRSLRWRREQYDCHAPARDYFAQKYQNHRTLLPSTPFADCIPYDIARTTIDCHIAVFRGASYQFLSHVTGSIASEMREINIER